MPKKRVIEHPWDRQEGEGAKAFEAFAIYRDMGPERSIRKVAQALDKSRTLIGNWSSTYEWVKRSDAWDIEQDRLSRIAQQKTSREMNERQARIAVTLQGKMLQALETLDPKRVKPQDLARIMELGLKYERIARGADAITQQTDESKNKAAQSLADAIQEAYKRRQGADD